MRLRIARHCVLALAIVAALVAPRATAQDLQERPDLDAVSLAKLGVL